MNARFLRVEGRAESARTVSDHLFDVTASTEENASEVWDLRGQPNSGFSYVSAEATLPLDLIVIGVLKPRNSQVFQCIKLDRCSGPLLLLIRPTVVRAVGVGKGTVRFDLNAKRALYMSRNTLVPEYVRYGHAL